MALPDCPCPHMTCLLRMHCVQGPGGHAPQVQGTAPNGCAAWLVCIGGRVGGGGGGGLTVITRPGTGGFESVKRKRSETEMESSARMERSTVSAGPVFSP